MKREPLFLISDDPDASGLVMTAFNPGSGDTLASCKVDKRLCARWVEKLIQPLVHESEGYWVGQHGYHP